MTPAQLIKDKHVRLRVAPAANGAHGGSTEQDPGTAPSWRTNITFKAMGWGMRETCDRLQLLAGDRLDIAYSLAMNDHPEFGGLELTLRDLIRASDQGRSMKA